MFEMWETLFYINKPSHFQQWNLNWDLAFPNSSIDSKLEFLSVVLGCISTVSQFTKRFWDFRISLWLDNLFQFRGKKDITSNCSQFSKELEKWHFWGLLDFIFFRFWEWSFRHSKFVGEKGTQIKIKLPLFEKKKCSY